MDNSMNTRQVKVTFDPSALPDVSPAPQVLSAAKMDAARPCRGRRKDPRAALSNPRPEPAGAGSGDAPASHGEIAELQANMNALQMRLVRFQPRVSA
jgi:hypothetical protein